jgi:mRNA interferase HicA
MTLLDRNSASPTRPTRAPSRNTRVAVAACNIHVALVNSSRAKRWLAMKRVTFAPGKGDHLIVTLNGRKSASPRHGGSREPGKGLWLAIPKRLDIME